jgi:tetratricopeptide (TPR) repeat protein
VSEVQLVDPATGRQFARLPAAGRPYCFSPDGSQLVTDAGRDGAFQVWDLRLIRRQLREMDLDWDRPPYPPAADGTTPLRARVLPAERPPPSVELDARAHIERGLLFVQLRQYARAWADFDRASTLDPQRSPWVEVVGAYSQAIDRTPKEAETYHWRAHARERLGRWEEAIADHSRAIQRAPSRWTLFVCRRRTYLRTGQVDKAATDLREARGRNADQMNGLARWLVTAPEPLHRDPTLAVELAKQAVRQAPREAVYWNTLGVAHYRSGEWRAALGALEEAEKRAPGTNFGFNAFFLAMCHHQLGDPAKANDNYDRAARWSQEDPGNLDSAQQQQLKALHAEAEALLKRPRHDSYASSARP